MTYTFQYGQVLGYLPYLLAGAWITLEIAFLATLISWLVGFPVGILSVIRPNSWLDHASRNEMRLLHEGPP